MTNNLTKQLKPTKKDENKEPKPQFFDLSNKEDQTNLSQLLKEQSHITVIDTYETQLKELFILDNPWLNMNPPQCEEEFKKHKEEHYKNTVSVRNRKDTANLAAARWSCFT